MPGDPPGDLRARLMDYVATRDLSPADALLLLPFVRAEIKAELETMAGEMEAAGNFQCYSRLLARCDQW